MQSRLGVNEVIEGHDGICNRIMIEIVQIVQHKHAERAHSPSPNMNRKFGRASFANSDVITAVSNNGVITLNYISKLHSLFESSMIS